MDNWPQANIGLTNLKLFQKKSKNLRFFGSRHCWITIKLAYLSIQFVRNWNIGKQIIFRAEETSWESKFSRKRNCGWKFISRTVTERYSFSCIILIFYLYIFFLFFPQFQRWLWMTFSTSCRQGPVPLRKFLCFSMGRRSQLMKEILVQQSDQRVIILIGFWYYFQNNLF